MERHVIRDTIKLIAADRGYLGMMIAIIALLIIYILYITSSVEPRDIQVITHYTSLGDSNFYKSSWLYLYNFAAFGVVIVVTNLALMAKLYKYERRDFGVGIGWLTIVLLCVGVSYVHAVLGLAFL